MKILLSYSFLLFILFIGYFARTAFADISCQPIYGGGETCIVSPNISINKEVLNPKTNKMVENLSINDPKYHPEFIVNFKVTVTNTGKSTINKIEVKDMFPQYITFSTGPGKFDDSTKTLSFSIDSLEPNEIKTFVVVGRVVSIDKLPQGVVCVVNRVIASANTTDQASDNTQLCIENKVVEKPSLLTETPPTGSKEIFLILPIIIGALGLMLRRMGVRLGRKARAKIVCTSTF